MPWTDETGCIVAGVRCTSCGYDLRTLRADGVCPECGTPVKGGASDVPAAEPNTPAEASSRVSKEGMYDGGNQ